MRWIDLARVVLIIALGYAVTFVSSLVQGEVVRISNIFETAMLMTILWAIRDGQEQPR